MESPNRKRDKYGNEEVLDLIMNENYTLEVTGLSKDMSYQLVEVFYYSDKDQYPIYESKLDPILSLEV